MEITRRSPVSGKIHTMNIPVLPSQLSAWRNGVLIQKAMPNISPDEREFIMTGITSTEWEELFGNDE